MLRYIFATFLFFLAALAASAQSRISVKEETFDDMETTAMVNPEKDRNNRDCALVIFHNVEPDGYYFDAGSVFIKAENHISRDNGEKTIFLYISEGAKLINIRHRDDGIMSLRYEFANGPLQARHTYHVFLGKVVPANANAKQYLRFKLTPPTASLEVEEQPGVFVPWTVNQATGMAAKALPLGDYAYRVQARQYHPTGGKAEMTDATKPHDEQVTLRPAFGTLEITAFDGATVSVDGENIADYSSLHLDPGVHSVKISRPRFKLYQTDVTIEEGKTFRLTPDFESNFSVVRLQASASDVAISLREVDSDRRLGIGSWQGELEAGDYTVVSSALGHRESVHTITVPAGARNLDITLPAPTPVYGSININSEPMGAKVTLDGKSAGETPTILSNVLMGSHTVELSAPGKSPFVVAVDVPENGSCDINAEMKDASSAKGAYVHNNSGKLFPVTDNLDELPDFIFHPLGYNGEWDLRDHIGEKSTKQKLITHFKKWGEMKQTLYNYEYKSGRGFKQKIGDINVRFKEIQNSWIEITYESTKSKQFEDIICYFSPIILRTIETEYCTRFECRSIADGFISISLSKYTYSLSITIKYNTGTRNYYYPTK